MKLLNCENIAIEYEEKMQQSVSKFRQETHKILLDLERKFENKIKMKVDFQDFMQLTEEVDRCRS